MQEIGVRRACFEGCDLSSDCSPDKTNWVMRGYFGMELKLLLRSHPSRFCSDWCTVEESKHVDRRI